MDDKENILKARKGREYSTINEFVTEVSRVIPHFAGEQKKDSVSVYPDERTIRYYMSAGLVDKPLKRGAASVFTRRHLLQVLSIKYLQSEYYPLPKIRELLSGADERMMEEMLVAGGAGPAVLPSHKIQMSSSLASESLKSMEDLSPDFIRMQTARVRAKRVIFPEKPAVSAKGSVKERMSIYIEEGFELNVDPGVLRGSKTGKKEFLEKLAARIRVLIQSEKKQGGA